MAVDEAAVARRFGALRPYLDERQRRLWLGVEAREWGHGGVAAVARAAGVSRPTVARAVLELEAPAEPLAAGRVRRPAGAASRRRRPALGWSRRWRRWWTR